MHVLVTNDDGIEARGLAELAALAEAEGLRVTVAAPHLGRSGASASLSALAQGQQLLVRQHPLPAAPGVPSYEVEATPAFIVLTGARGAFGFVPDLVLSGMNHGPNTGHAVLHSGTVGAALTAYTQGIRAMAVSITGSSPSHWDTAVHVTRTALRWYLSVEDPYPASVNIPDVPAAELRGLRPATLAALGAVQAQVGQVGEGFVGITLQPVDVRGEPGSDVDLLARGYATVTMLATPSMAGTQPSLSTLGMDQSG